MKVAFVVGSFPALSETFILNQITGLIDRGHSVDIYASGAREDPKCHPDVDRYGLIERTTYMQASTSKRLTDFAERLRANPLEIWRALRRRMEPSQKQLLGFAQPDVSSSRPYDIVHCHFGNVAADTLRRREAGQLQGKLVTTFYGADVTSWVVRHGLGVYRELFAQGDLFLAICQSFTARLIDMGCDAGLIKQHALGIEPSRFPLLPRQLAAGEPVRIVSTARLVEKKGLQYALRALAQIHSTMQVEYTIVGDGPLRPELEALAARLPANVRVRFAGWLEQPEVAGILRDCHLLMAPSVTAADGDQEGTPVAILEAMASGMPVIATRHSGIPEVVEEGVSGRLVPERDVDALARAIAQTIESPASWKAMGEAGRARIERNHDINKLNDTLVLRYESLGV